MTADERRRELIEQLVVVFGEDVADTFAEYLPPAGQHAASAEQLEALRSELMAYIDAQLDARIAALRVATDARFDGLRAEMAVQFAEARAETNEQITGVRVEVERLRSAWRRDLLVIAVPQVLLLAGVIVAVLS